MCADIYQWQLKQVSSHDQLTDPVVKVMVLVSGQSGCVFNPLFTKDLTNIRKPGTNTFLIGRHDYADV